MQHCGLARCLAKSLAVKNLRNAKLEYKSSKMILLQATIPMMKMIMKGYWEAELPGAFTLGVHGEPHTS
jgi:hypothetical protein